MGYLGRSPTAALSSSLLQDADKNTKVQVEESSNENIIRFDTNGSQHMELDAYGKLGLGTAASNNGKLYVINTQGITAAMIQQNTSGEKALLLKGGGTGTGVTLACQDSGGTDRFTVKDNGFATGQFVVNVWVRYNGTGTIAINDSYNVSSITDNGTGNTTINFSSNLANSNYACAGTNNWYGIANFGNSAVGSVLHSNRDLNGSMRDATVCHAMIIGD